VNICPTPHKVRYESRKAAKRARRRAHPEDSRIRAYRCPCGSFHLGHLPQEAITTSRSQVFGGARPELRPLPTPSSEPRVLPTLDERRARTIVIPAHVFFAMQLCEHPRCGQEQPCSIHHGRKAA
jgi:hypothetical protein